MTFPLKPIRLLSPSGGTLPPASDDPLGWTELVGLDAVLPARPATAEAETGKEDRARADNPGRSAGIIRLHPGTGPWIRTGDGGRSGQDHWGPPQHHFL